MEITTCKVLKDEAAIVDMFDNKPHENVANALANYIKGNEDGLTIGLEGEWGSGKSTVIRLLRDKLTNDANVFIFDAWAHEGDTLRRSFLEALLSYFICNDTKNEKLYYENELKKVSNLQKTTKTKVHKRLTSLGYFTILTTLLMPIGVHLSRIPSLFPLEACGKWSLYILGFSFTFSFAIFLAIYIIFLLVCQIKNHRKKIFFNGENWAFLKVNGEDVETKSITDEPERSSIEFETIFKKNVGKWLEEKNKKLVFVIDNLDRINVEDALKIWSTLQTFLQSRNGVNHESASILKLLWIIVPYDANGLKRLWSSNDEDGIITHSFFEKCFQLRLEVPTPIMSSWVNYAREQAKDLFKDTQAISKIINVLQLTRKSLADSPTPREIKTYLNQVLATSMVADTSIPLESICFYVIERFVETPSKSIDEIRNCLLSVEYPGLIKASLPKTVKEDIAGLTYGIAPKKGQQLLLSGPIEEAIEKDEAEKFKELADEFGDGFWQVFDYIIKNRSNWGMREDDRRYNLEHLKIVDVAYKSIKEDEKEKLETLYKKVIYILDSHWKNGIPLTCWNFVHLRKIKSLVKLIVLFDNSNYIGNIYTKLFGLLNAVLDPINESRVLSKELIRELMSVVNEIPKDKRKPFKVDTLVDENLIEFANNLPQENLIELQKNLLFDVDYVIEFLIPKNSEIFSTKNRLDVVIQLLSKQQNVDFSPIVDGIDKQFSSTTLNHKQTPLSSQILRLLLGIIDIENDSQKVSIRDGIINILQRSSFVHYYKRCNDADKKYFILLLISFVGMSVNDIKDRNIITDIQSVLTPVSQNIEDVLRFLDSNELKNRFWMLAFEGNNEMFVALLKVVLESNNWEQYIQPHKVRLQHLLKLYKMLNIFSMNYDKYEVFFVLLVKLKNYGITFDSIVKEEKNIETFNVFNLLLNEQSPYKEDVQLIEKVINNYQEEDFFKLLKAKCSIFLTFSRVKELNPKFEVDLSLLHTFRRVLQEFTDDEFNDFTQVISCENFASIIMLVNSHNRDAWLMEFTRKIFNREIKNISPIKLEYVKKILRVKKLSEREIEDYFNAMFVLENLKEFLGWLANLQKILKDENKWTPSESLCNAAKGPLSKLLNNIDETKKKSLIGLMDAFGISYEEIISTTDKPTP